MKVLNNYCVLKALKTDIFLPERDNVIGGHNVAKMFSVTEPIFRGSPALAVLHFCSLAGFTIRVLWKVSHVVAQRNALFREQFLPPVPNRFIIRLMTISDRSRLCIFGVV